MKNIKYLLFLILVLFTFSTVKAGTATTITSATYDTAFKIKGTGTGQISIAIFDLENNPIYFTTVAATNGTFSITLPEIAGLKNGNYKVKAADYDGTNAVSKTVKVLLPTNPETGDSLNYSLIIGSISLIGLIGVGIYFKKKNA